MRAALAVLAGLLCGCIAGGEAGVRYQPNRTDYAEFRRGFPELLEPNYLPFMATRVRVESAPRRLARRLGLPLAPAPELLVFCRWQERDFPLSVYVVPPRIPDELTLDYPGRRPPDYVDAAWRALQRWEEALDGLARFERAPSERTAELVVRLSASPFVVEEPEVQVLGATPLGSACRVLGGDPASGRIDVRFEVSAIEVRVADEFGLLLPDQVERIALHEIGHALGMRTHSPIPADLMYPVVRDRLPRGELGTEDVNSFLSLYSIPNGTVFRVLPPGPLVTPPAPLPEGAPAVELAPHVDPRLGYEIQLPLGWTRLDTGFGVVAVDGVTWDYEASFQVIVRGFESIDAYLARHGERHFATGPLRETASRPVAGRPARQFLFDASGGRSEGLVLVESGDGRVVVVLWDCPRAELGRFRPWFDASLGTLELRKVRGPERSRDYLGSSTSP